MPGHWVWILVLISSLGNLTPVPSLPWLLLLSNGTNLRAPFIGAGSGGCTQLPGGLVTAEA